MIARYYNGCWDDETQARLNKEDALLAALRKVVAEAHCTYFPAEGMFQIHAWGKPLSDFHNTRMGALEEALRRVAR